MIKKAAFKFLIFLAWAGLCTGAAMAQNPASEYEIKAAFLYNFIKFVEWPTNAFPDKDAPFVIGVLGEDPFAIGGTAGHVNFLEQAVQGKTINDRKLVVRHGDRLTDLKNCQLIFVSRSERNRLKEIFSAVQRKPILTVGDSENFCQQGGMINFVQQSGKVRFEINLNAAEKAHLKISSKLLNVAILIEAPNR